jgi:hypothetical protein
MRCDSARRQPRHAQASSMQNSARGCWGSYEVSARPSEARCRITGPAREVADARVREFRRNKLTRRATAQSGLGQSRSVELLQLVASTSRPSTDRRSGAGRASGPRPGRRGYPRIIPRWSRPLVSSRPCRPDRPGPSRRDSRGGRVGPPARPLDLRRGDVHHGSAGWGRLGQLVSGPTPRRRWRRRCGCSGTFGSPVLLRPYSTGCTSVMGCSDVRLYGPVVDRSDTPTMC